MQQYDLHGSQHGCRSSLVNMEARPIDAKMITRRCIVARLLEITVAKYRELLTENAGALLVLLPQDYQELSADSRKHLQSLERDLLMEETAIPVYFATETEELREIYEDIKRSSSTDQAATAVEALLSAATANGFQMVINGAQSKSLSDFQITNIQGHLAGFGIEEQLPTVAIVAHYDAFGIAPGLAQGADSNGSGVIALLEIARLFSKLYTNSRTHAKYNLIFLLTGGGKFNYQGTKRWIEDNLDSSETNVLSDISYALCLDSLGSTDELYLHVSKPPRDGSAGGIFVESLENVIKTYYPEVTFKVVHKKINLADDTLAWEHERFSIKRLPGFTLSHIDTPRSDDRNTILDTRGMVDEHKLTRNVQILAEALARHIYNMTEQRNVKLFTDTLAVQSGLVTAWLDQLVTHPRATQLLGKDHILLNSLEETMNRYLKDTKRTTLRADKRDPEFVFYDGAVYKMSAFNVKPAIFDLFLGLAIASYLGIMYFAAVNFSMVSFMEIRLQMSSRTLERMPIS
ncbi:hypothetical protein ScPMuIL_017437 [Solemya velum]